tara:strand:+ start:766 stop:933 length:168 start_codon:yes stop_codon:yes gene_type:complete
MNEKMVKMKSLTKPEGDFKFYKESDVDKAKKNGWVLFDEPKTNKPKKAKKVKGGK